VLQTFKKGLIRMMNGIRDKASDIKGIAQSVDVVRDDDATILEKLTEIVSLALDIQSLVDEAGREIDKIWKSTLDIGDYISDIEGQCSWIGTRVEELEDVVTGLA